MSKIRDKWEIYLDESYYHMWAVREIGDRDFNSSRLFHFIDLKDAKVFKKLLEEKAKYAERADLCSYSLGGPGLGNGPGHSVY